MAKRAARRAKLHAIDSARIHNVIFDHTLANDRDQSYVKKVRPRSDNQRALMEAIDSKPLTVALGPAGTGKTYLAIAAAVEALESGSVSRIVLSRPAVEAGENLGFLPGDMREKLDPYLRPLWDALNDRLGAKRLSQHLDDGTIEIAPVAFMRGRTLNNAFVLIDEAQNCTYGQLKMLLTDQTGFAVDLQYEDWLVQSTPREQIETTFAVLAELLAKAPAETPHP